MLDTIPCSAAVVATNKAFDVAMTVTTIVPTPTVTKTATATATVTHVVTETPNAALRRSGGGEEAFFICLVSFLVTALGAWFL